MAASHRPAPAEISCQPIQLPKGCPPRRSPSSEARLRSAFRCLERIYGQCLDPGKKRRRKADEFRLIYSEMFLGNVKQLHWGSHATRNKNFGSSTCARNALTECQASVMIVTLSWPISSSYVLCQVLTSNSRVRSTSHGFQYELLFHDLALLTGGQIHWQGTSLTTAANIQQ
jgi:hypothetical protein